MTPKNLKRQWLSESYRYSRRIGHIIWRYLYTIYQAYSRHEGSMMACACAYCILLSLVPLLAFGIAVIGFFIGGSERALHSFIASVEGFLPLNPRFLQSTLGHVLASRGTLGLIGLVGLLYGAHQAFLVLENALNLIWEVHEPRKWYQRRLVALEATVLAILFMGADVSASVIMAFFSHLFPYLTSSLRSLMQVGLTLLPLVLTTLLFYELYRLLPAYRPPKRPAFIGALVAAIFWELIRIAFSFFLLRFHSYDKLYGSLSKLVALVIWTYYSMVIFLLGAEIAADLARKARKDAQETTRAEITSIQE
ncbi:YihY/virulence factor BrkB family protein [Chthonomonas calidirosea]|nr:YihY/virulence factor BrkB family protein [Chthonomonas calidirosea]